MPLQRKIYFSGSIYAGRQHAHTYPAIVKILRRYGTVLTEHIAEQDIATKPSLQTGDDVRIRNQDIAWLHEAHCVVADTTIPSTGVGIEIGTAALVGKPILCLHHANAVSPPSCMVSGDVEITLVRYLTIGDIAQAIANFFEKEFGGS